LAVDSQQQAYLKTMGISLYQSQSLSELELETSTISRPDNGKNQPGDLAALDWRELNERVRACVECGLHSGRTQTVFGLGNQQADLLIIEDAPDADEDRQGEPFVGHAGQLLNEMLKTIGFSRNQVYITNILKCRPPNNRDPQPEEAECCASYLYRQIELLQPKLILAMGQSTAQLLLKTNMSLAQLRSSVHKLKETRTSLMVTYHPAYLLRSPAEKRNAWEDLLLVKQNLDNFSE